MLLKTEVDFARGQMVYLKTDPDQYPRMVTAIILTLNGPMYRLRCLTEEQSEHYAAEISLTDIVD